MRFYHQLAHRHNLFYYLSCVLLAIGTVVFYGYCANILQENSSHYYSRLGNAFLEGHTYLDEEPSQELLSSRNPYAPHEHNFSNSLWDASLYNDKYYLYFGPVPVLFPWLPVELLSGIRLSDRQLTFLFSAVGISSLIGLLACLGSGQSPAIMGGIALGILAVGWGSWIPTMLHRPSFYEVAISGAFCYTALGLLSLFCATRVSSRRARYLALLGSLCFGMAAGCRIFYGLNAIILLMVWLGGVKHRSSWREHLHAALYLGFPWSICITAMAAYNYARFGSIFESGIRYQLSIYDYHNGYAQFWNISNFWKNYRLYLFRPLPWRMIFPWIQNAGYFQKTELPFGLLRNSLFAWWSLWFLLNICKSRAWLGSAYSLVCGITLFALAMTLFILCYNFPLIRYLVDFSPWVMLVAVFGFIDALKGRTGRRKTALLAIGGIMALTSAYSGIATAVPLRNIFFTHSEELPPGPGLPRGGQDRSWQGMKSVAP